MRQQGEKTPRWHAWLETLEAHRTRPCLFLAETVFVYFLETQVKSLVLRLRDRFPGAELVLDGWRPFEIWVGNRYLSPSKFAGLMQWGLWSGREIEGWGATSLTGAGIRPLDEWGFLDESEPRLAHIRWLRPIESLLRAMRIYHFGLGKGPSFF